MKTDLERFEQKYIPVPESGCWLWTAQCQSNGYGRFAAGREADGSYQSVYAHRFAYERFVGPIPESMFVCHTCDMPSCVNPAHLFLGTPAANMADKVKKGRQHRPRGRNNTQAKISEDEALQIRASSELQRVIAKRFGISQSQVSNIKRGQRWAISA